MQHPNAELARRFLEALDAQDLDTIETLVADDVVAHFPGTNKVSGTYKGGEQVFSVFAKGDELTGGTFERELHDVTASNGTTRLSPGMAPTCGMSATGSSPRCGC